MKIQLTAAYLKQAFPAYDLDWGYLLDQLQLDMGHIQLLRDFQRNWPQTDPVLLFCLLSLVDAVNQGSLCLLLDNPRFNQIGQRCGLQNMAAHLSQLDMTSYELRGESILCLDGHRLYFQKYHQQEQELNHNLLSLIGQNHTRKFSHDQIKDATKAVVNSLPYSLESKQIQALLTAVLQPFSIISGGPGTGKTTILLSVLRVLLRLGVAVKDMALAAPTGRAAYRISESLAYGLSECRTDEIDQALLAIEASTIHRLLGVNPQRSQNRFHTNNPLPFKLVVIDEVSMVDLMLMNQLIQAIALDTRIILLGDQFQLPSVNTGAMLADLMPPVGFNRLNTTEFQQDLIQLWPDQTRQPEVLSNTTKPQLMTDKVTVLTVSKRCQPNIAALSGWVRKGRSHEFFHSVPIHQPCRNMGDEPNWQPGVNWIQAPADDFQYWPHICQSWLSHHYFHEEHDDINYGQCLSHLHHLDPKQLKFEPKILNRLFVVINSQRILTLLNHGQQGADFINSNVSSWIKKRLQVTGCKEIFHGALIMVQRNDAALGLYNGDVGVVLETKQDQFHVCFQQGQAFTFYSVHVLPQFKLAFAMTVHKSQGSEFNHVLMPLPAQLDHRMLSREIIYTGMTRAKQTVCFYGSQAAITTGIERQTTRHSGLTFWYNENNSQRD